MKEEDFRRIIREELAKHEEDLMNKLLKPGAMSEKMKAIFEAQKGFFNQ